VVIEGHRDPLPGPGKVEDAGVTAVAVLTEQQALNAQLHPLGLPRSLRDVRRAAPLRVNRHDSVPGTLEQVDLGNQAEARRRQHHRSCDAHLALVRERGRTAGGVDLTVMPPPLDGVEIVGELSADPLEVEQAWAVAVLVDHASRDEVRHARRAHRAASASVNAVPKLP
jgi:hypothetical protein